MVLVDGVNTRGGSRKGVEANEGSRSQTQALVWLLLHFLLFRLHANDMTTLFVYSTETISG